MDESSGVRESGLRSVGRQPGMEWGSLDCSQLGGMDVRNLWECLPGCAPGSPAQSGNAFLRTTDGAWIVLIARINSPAAGRRKAGTQANGLERGRIGLSSP